MTRNFLSVVLAAISYNFLFLSNSTSHVKVGLVWLAVLVLLWLPDLWRRYGWGD